MYELKLSESVSKSLENFPNLRTFNDAAALVCKLTSDWGGMNTDRCSMTRALISERDSEVKLSDKIEMIAKATAANRACIPLALTPFELSPVEYLGTALGTPTRFLCTDVDSTEIVDTFHGRSHVIIDRM